MKATKRINVEVLRKKLLPKIDAVQYDTGLQIILIVRDFTIPDGTTAKAFFKKPSGKFVYQDCTISGNEITIDVHNQALTEYGYTCYQVRLTNGSDIITTFKGIIEVEKSLADNSATPSETVVPAFDAAVQDAVTEIEEARDSAITYIGNGLDNTLKVEGKAADAAAAGKAIDELKGDFTYLINGESSLELVQSEAWDDSTASPTAVKAEGYTRVKRLLAYSENNHFIGANNYISIFYDSNYEKIGTIRNSIIPQDETVKANAKFIAIFWVGVITENPKLILDSEFKKIVSKYGVSPENNGDTNAINLQKCLDGGGTIIFDQAGIYDIGRTIYVDSNTTIIFCNGVYVKRATNNDGKKAKHLFVNRGASTRHYNENISIYGLKIIPNGAFADEENDVNLIHGLRGLVSFFYIKNLVIDGFELIDTTYTDYALQVCTFENVQIRNVEIQSKKDGIHFGRGRCFTIEHCKFLTNDDAIALNAVDYTYSNAETGWIEDGTIKDITFLSADGTDFTAKRGILLLAGSWMEWTSGRYYKECGDYCLSNGKLYQTCGRLGVGSEYYKIGTSQPTHTEGVVQYDDGLIWMYKEEASGMLNASIRNVKFEDLYFYRNIENVALFSSEYSPYIRAVYTDTTLSPIQNITFDGVNILGESKCFLQFETWANNIKINNSNIKSLTEGFLKFRENDTMSMKSNVRMSLVGNYYDFANDFIYYVGSGEKPNVTLSVAGSMCGDGFAFVQNSTLNPTFRLNDLNN